MGWWETEENDNFIGDTPTDTIASTLTYIAETREEQDKGKPTLQELLNSILATLQTNPEGFIAEGKTICIRRLIALVIPELESVTSSEANKADSQVANALCDAFEEVAVEYEDSELERKPKLTELLTSMAFVLGYQPEEYLSIAEGASIKKIFAELD